MEGLEGKASVVAWVREKNLGDSMVRGTVEVDSLDRDHPDPVTRPSRHQRCTIGPSL